MTKKTLNNVHPSHDQSHISSQCCVRAWYMVYAAYKFTLFDVVVLATVICVKSWWFRWAESSKEFYHSCQKHREKKPSASLPLKDTPARVPLMWTTGKETMPCYLTLTSIGAFDYSPMHLSMFCFSSGWWSCYQSKQNVFPFFKFFLWMSHPAAFWGVIDHFQATWEM